MPTLPLLVQVRKTPGSLGALLDGTDRLLSALSAPRERPSALLAGSERELKRRMRRDVGDWQRERFLVGTGTWLRGMLAEGGEAAALRFGAAVTGKLTRAEVQSELDRTFGVELQCEALVEAHASRPEAYAVTALWHACRRLVCGYQVQVVDVCPTVPLHRDVLLAKRGNTRTKNFFLF